MTTTLVEPFFTEVNSYIGLRDAIRRRVSTLDISRTTLDEITGLPLGYSGKPVSYTHLTLPTNREV